MAKFIDRTGEKFGRLTFERYLGGSRWLLRCDCGNYHISLSNNVVRGLTQSCGCQRAENKHKHGMYQTPEYSIWRSMKHRCESDERYAGRGITVCERWATSFANFLADMGERPTEEHSIDRIDNDGNYEPGNCRWATRSEQGRNTRQNRLVSYHGQTKCLAAWAEELGIAHYILRERLAEGWTIERAFTERPIPRKTA